MADHFDIRTTTVRRDIAVECLDDLGTRAAVEAELFFEPSDPYAVTMTFCTADQVVPWVLGRELLLHGLTQPAGDGDVHVWPSLDPRGRTVVMLELDSPDGRALFQMPTSRLTDFLNYTLAVVPLGAESEHVDLDLLVDRLLDRAD